jgi:hypothetical protein
MSWKKLIFTNVNEETTNEVVENKKENGLSFPKKENINSEENTSFFNVSENDNFNVIKEVNLENPHLASVIEVYDNGFEKMNKEGVDFYEFYKSIIIGDVNNLQLYPMAFNMLKNLNPNFTKESAEKDSDFYLSNIQSAYESLKSSGENKKDSLIQEKENEKKSLTKNISNIKNQLEKLKNDLNQSEMELNAIDLKYETPINDVTLKLEANEIAKNKLTTNIKKVVDNLKTTIN